MHGIVVTSVTILRNPLFSIDDTVGWKLVNSDISGQVCQTGGVIKKKILCAWEAAIGNLKKTKKIDDLAHPHEIMIVSHSYMERCDGYANQNETQLLLNFPKASTYSGLCGGRYSS